jgi:hypothetical protein
MLIDAKHLRAGSARPLGDQTPEKVFGLAFYGGTPNPFAFGDTAAADSVPMIFEDLEAERFGGVLVRHDSREALAEAVGTCLAQPVLSA